MLLSIDLPLVLNYTHLSCDPTLLVTPYWGHDSGVCARVPAYQYVSEDSRVGGTTPSGRLVFSLRSHAEPWGMGTLGTDEQRTVEHANTMLKEACSIILDYDRRAIAWTCENPKGSYVWMFVPSLLAVPDVRNVEFQFCMHGGDRDKKSRILASGDLLGPLLATSDRQHHHAPWQCALHSDRFRRSHRLNEGAYSAPLRDKCETLAAGHGAWTTRACVKAAAISPGTRVGRRAIHAESHAAANVQHRSDAFVQDQDFFSTQPELRWNGLQGVQAASSRHARLEASVRKEADSWMSDREEGR